MQSAMVLMDLVCKFAGEIPGTFCILFKLDVCLHAAKEPFAPALLKQLLGHTGLS